MTKNGESIITSVSQIFYVFLDGIANEVRVRAFFSSLHFYVETIVFFCLYFNRIIYMMQMK